MAFKTNRSHDDLIVYFADNVRVTPRIKGLAFVIELN